MRCPNCQSDNPDTSRFCSDCGTRLGVMAEAAFTRTLETPTGMLARGTVFAARYEIIEPIGRGGMGVIYRAFDKKLQEEIAIKLLKPEIAVEKRLVQRFSNELKVARRVSHHNVCRLHDLHEEGETLYLTMEYVRGEDLKRLIRRTGTLSIGKTVSIVRQIAEGLAEAHKLGVVHRDLKPSNVMIDGEGNAKIMDFGIARSMAGAGMTAEGSMIGTPEYMSPEQVESRGIDGRSDLYSLGVILFEMVTGQVPFEGETPLSVAFKHKSENPQDPRTLNPRIPEALSRLILRCLEKDRSKRYQTAEEILADLAVVEAELPVTENVAPRRTPLTPREITVKVPVRKLLVPAAVVLGLATIGFLAWHFLFREVVPGPGERHSVAVITFENQTGDPSFNYLQDAVPNLLITSLEQSPFIRVTSWERLRDLLKQTGREDQAVIGRDLGFELCRMEGIEAIVLGSFVKAGNVFATDVKVLDVATKKILNTVSSQGDSVDSILRKQIDELSREIVRGFSRGARGLQAGPSPITEVTTSSLEAYNAFLRGREEYEKFYLAEARKSLEEAVRLDPEFAAAYSTLVWVYNSLGNTESARGALRNLEKYGRRVKGKEGLHIQAQLALLAERDNDKYGRLLEKLTADYPDDKRAWTTRGGYYSEAGKYDQAEECLKKALALDPKFGPAVNLLAYAYGYQNKFDEAIRAFELYASISPGDANPYDSLGDLYFRMGRMDAAVERYKAALRIKPDFGSSVRISYICALSENYPEALKWVDEYIAAAPSSGQKAVGYELKAVYHYLFGSVRRALEEMDTARGLLTSENDTNAINSLYRAKIWICYDWGMRDLFLEFAKERFDWRAQHGVPTELFNKVLYLFYQGLDDVREKRPDQAELKLAAIGKARDAEKDPMNLFWIKNAYGFLLSELRLNQGHGAEALEAFSKMGETSVTIGRISSLLQNNIPLIRDFPARAYLATGEIDKAVAEYERLTSPDPMVRRQEIIHPFSRLRLARLYEARGEKAKALVQYEKLAEIWKDADSGLAPVEEARRRLEALKGR
jgi:serine/threonine protein kinase/tetratricopeptide (TPR) repeat protein